MQKLLQLFGADAKETGAFLKLLELGAQPIGVLSQQLRWPRSTTYLRMERLKKLGLVEEFEHRGIRYVKCTAPEALKELISRRERKLERLREMFQEELPKLQAMEGRRSITPKIRHFEGKEAVRGLYEHVLHGRSFDAIFNPEAVKKGVPEYHYLIPTVAENKNVHLRELLMASREATFYKKKFISPNHEIKILPRSFHFSSDTIITQDTIYMIAYDNNEMSGLEIRNPILAKTQRLMFEAMWNTTQ